MKKSLLALAVLGAFATAASAQSSVTLYGKLDQGIGKAIGSTDKGLIDAAGSRVGLRGSEDIGGGLFGVFGFEHRFDPQTGQQNPNPAVTVTNPVAPATTPTATATSTFWNGYSWVGLRTGFGQVTLGRHYTAAFLTLQNTIDPFGGDTVAALRGVAMLDSGATTATRVRTSKSIYYGLAAGGFGLAFDIAEARQVVGTATGTKKPWSVAVNYGAGPFWIGLSQEKSGVETPNSAKATNYGLRFQAGPASLRLGGLSATRATNAKVTGMLVAANVVMGPGEFKIGYATKKTKTGATEVDNNKKLGLGYHYNLSKRTKVYFDVARDSADAFKAEDKGYDIGVQHNF